MSFKGLFIGVDKYQSPFIGELNCAARDAKLLYSLLTDNLSGQAELVTNEEATKDNIVTKLNELKSATSDDIVVIAFSGHGSDEHHLVTYDADTLRLDDTALTLEELTTHFAEINARQVLLILDCCFSGGAGAKVFNSPIRSRSSHLVNDLLNAMGGKGKVIFTASQAKEEAWENGLLKNGLLTYYLVEHLLLKDENNRGQKQTLLSVFETVSKKVQEESLKLGKEQHPTIRGSIDETLEWPYFEKGVTYHQHFPERTFTQIQSSITELQEYGFDQKLIDTWRGGVTDLNDLQLNAINHGGLLMGHNLLIVAPTSSGKTLIGELAALKAVQAGQKAIFLFPLKALVNDKLSQFIKQYGEYGIRTIKATGESTTDDMAQLLRGKYDICLMTYEKFTSVALGSPHVLERLGCVVVDEVQMITNKNRGTNLEFLLTLIKMKEKEGVQPQIVALSAVVGETMDFESWLRADLIKTEKRPVPIVEGVIDLNGTYHFIAEGEEKTEQATQAHPYKNSSQDVIIPLVSKLVAENKQVIVFRATRGEARGTANYLAENLQLAPATDDIEKLPRTDVSIMGKALRNSLRGGVALHVSDLIPAERQVIESSFRKKDSKIRVIVATPTLAMGVNTPAEAVVISGLMHSGSEPYSVAEYKNMVGRAGRLGFSTNGESYTVALNQRDANEYWHHYVNGELENLSSRFFSAESDIRTVILRIIAASTKIAGKGLTQELIIEFIDASFATFLEKKSSQESSYKDNLPQAFAQLEQAELITLNDEGQYCLTPLGELIAKSTLEVDSALRVISTAQQLTAEELNDPTLVALTQLCHEVDDVYFPLNKKGAGKEAQSWYSESQRQGVAQTVLTQLRVNTSDDVIKARRAKKIVACLTWMSSMSMADMEAVLTRHGGLDGAAGAVRNTTSRTGDFITVVAEICEHVLKVDSLKNQALKLQTRLETGAPADIVHLASECGTNLTRADYQALTQRGLTHIDVLMATDDAVLLEILENDTAKLQVIKQGLESFATREERQQALPEIPLFI